MPPLKVTKAEVFLVDYGYFERFVESVYKREYRFTAAEEIPNDIEKMFDNITGTLDELEQEDIRRFREKGEYTFRTRAILDDLCNQGLIEPGHYVIRVCW